MMNELSQAISLAMISPDPALKTQAIQYCDRIRESPNSYKLCLEKLPENNEVKFFLLQILEQTLRSSYHELPSCDQQLIKQSLWNLIKDESQPCFILTKLYLLLVLLFKTSYPNQYPLFFTDLMAIAETNTNAFLQISIMIDEEVVCLLIQRSQQEISHNINIKDLMRETCLEPLTKVWHSIFLNSKAIETTRLCLKVFGLYVAWVDIGYILTDTFISNLYQCLQIEQLRNHACDCLGNIILKGMKHPNKLALIRMLNIIPVIQQVRVDDIEFEENLAKLVNSVGLELSHAFDESEEKFTAVQLLGELFPLLVLFLGNEYDDTAAALFPFLSHYLLILKRQARYIILYLIY
jgi:exportin-T